MKLVCPFLFWVAIVTFIQAESPPSSPTPEPSAQVAENKLREQTILLSDQNRLLREYNKDILSVVYWSLGFAALFLLGFLGLIGYLTNRRYEQDRLTVLSSVESALDKARAELISKFAESRNSLETRLAKTSAELRQRLDSIAEAKAKAATSPLKAEIGALRTEITYHQAKVLEEEANELEKGKSLRRALAKQFETAQKGWSIRYEFVVSDALKAMERLLSAGATFDPDEIREVNIFLGKLPSEFEPL